MFPMQVHHEREHVIHPPHGGQRLRDLPVPGRETRRPSAERRDSPRWERYHHINLIYIDDLYIFIYL